MGGKHRKWINERYGRWTVLSIAGDREAVAKCDCGTVRTVDRRTLAEGRSRSCGCLRDELARARLCKTFDQAIWARIAIGDPDECWEWQGSRDAHGYGIAQKRHGTTRVHRQVWAEQSGPIPPGLCVIHSCDNPPCCNPAHLRIGTQKQNVMDRVDRHRSRHWNGETSYQAKFTMEEARAIRRRYSIGGITMRKLAAEYGVSYPTIRLIIIGRRYREDTTYPNPS